VRGAIRCPYHAWRTPSTIARRLAVRRAADVPEASKRLHPSPSTPGRVRVRESHAGRAHAAEQLGGAIERVKRYPLAGLRAAKTLRYDVAANWKVILENYNDVIIARASIPTLPHRPPLSTREARDWIGNAASASRGRRHVHRDRHDVARSFSRP